MVPETELRQTGSHANEAGMRVMEIRDEWGLENLKPGQRPDPTPEVGEVVVRIEAASVNYRDLVMAGRGYGRRSGELPLVPVSDGAGTVVATGPGVTGCRGRSRLSYFRADLDRRIAARGPLDRHAGRPPRRRVLQELMLLRED